MSYKELKHKVNEILWEYKKPFKKIKKDYPSLVKMLNDNNLNINAETVFKETAKDIDIDLEDLLQALSLKYKFLLDCFNGKKEIIIYKKTKDSIRYDVILRQKIDLFKHLREQDLTELEKLL